MVKIKSKNFAFTLAEVLITLGIIGVVAAMTIPTLISKYHKKVVETRLQKVYSVMNQAIKMSTIDNGETTTWPQMGISSNPTGNYDSVLAWYNQYLAPYLKVSKVERVSEEEDTLAIYFPDGSVLTIPNYLYDMTYFVDVKCFKEDNCEAGVDKFAFRFLPKIPPEKIDHPAFQHSYSQGLATYGYGWNGTFDDAKYCEYSSAYGCYNVNGNRGFCAKLIQLNGWKIPDDYPYKF